MILNPTGLKVALFAVVFGATLIFGCKNRSNGETGTGSAETPMTVLETMAEDLITVDCTFGSLAVDSGLPSAINRYAANSAVALRDGFMPVEGKEAVIGIFNQIPGGHLYWEPYFADVSTDGQFGYTLGRYQSTTDEASGPGASHHGYYTTIWKKQADGNWRFVLNSSTSSPPDDDKK